MPPPDERDQKIAAGRGKLFADAKKTRRAKPKADATKTGTSSKRSGTQRARGPKRAS